jgi:excisionase family DNA binding protein
VSAQAVTESAGLDLAEVARQLGVHYQTAYRWVRAGRLDAVLVAGRYRIRPDVLQRFSDERRAPRPPPARRPRTGFAPVAEHVLDALVEGDERLLSDRVRDLLDSGVSLTAVVQEVLGPAMAEVGARWEAGTLDIAIEHRASAMVGRVLGEHFPRPRGRRRGRAVVAAVSGDRHSLPVTMAAVALAEDQWHVEVLGADLPVEELERFVDRRPVDLVVITVTEPSTSEQARHVGARLDESGVPALCGAPGRSLVELQQMARERLRRSR